MLSRFSFPVMFLISTIITILCFYVYSATYRDSNFTCDLGSCATAPFRILLSKILLIGVCLHWPSSTVNFVLSYKAITLCPLCIIIIIIIIYKIIIEWRWSQQAPSKFLLKAEMRTWINRINKMNDNEWPSNISLKPDTLSRCYIDMSFSISCAIIHRLKNLKD